MRIRTENIRSQKAAEKLPYVINANETRKSLIEQLNSNGNHLNYLKYQKIYIHCIHLELGIIQKKLLSL